MRLAIRQAILKAELHLISYDHNSVDRQYYIYECVSKMRPCIKTVVHDMESP